MNQTSQALGVIAAVAMGMDNQPLSTHSGSSWRIYDIAIVKGSRSKKVNTRTRTRKCGRGY